MFIKKAYLLLIGSFWLNVSCLFAQDQKIADSLSLIYKHNTLPETAKLELLTDLSFNETKDLNLGLKYAEELINLAEQSGDDEYLRLGFFLKGTKKRLIGNLDEALAAYIKCVELAQKLHFVKGEGEAYGAIADTYSDANNFINAKYYYLKAITTLQRPKVDSISLASVLLNLGDLLLKNRNYDSALLYLGKAKTIFDKIGAPTGIAYSLGNIGMVYAGIGKIGPAEENIYAAIDILEESQDYYPICVYLISLADMYLKKGDIQTAFNYSKKSLSLAEQHGLKQQIANACLKLSELYEKAGNTSKAFKYYKEHIANRDSVTNIKSVQKMFDLRTDYLLSQNQLEINKVNQKNLNQKKLLFSLVIIVFLTTVISFILYKNNQNKQKAYKVLNLQKQETEVQKAKAEDALTELKVTQKQLIQSAKMASLGELAAGIAHELKNPLNFVNNFSEVSIEILDELREAALNKLPATDRAEADLIMNDLSENLTKINNHGKRADSIVIGMLQHLRPYSGNMELSNINTLAAEYLRLSYHGLSTLEKEFIANITTDFDKSIPDTEVLHQDIGKVLQNIYLNAFYSILQKKDLNNASFEPLISVITKKLGNKIELRVKDNGMGIPEKVLDKIFQPFFTTKPPGKGTGLGLSLSYDIIIAHGGELKVETKEGEFAEFIILLPIGNNHGA